MYALIGAHLAHLVLNWHNDAFVLRQRINCFGIDRKPPALSSSSVLRSVRLLMVILILAFKINSTLSPEKDFSEVSHVTHIFGALFGFLSGCIFLRARSAKKAIRYAQNIPLVLIYGSAALWIFSMFRMNTDKEWCPWIEYERKCQDQCYLHNKSTSSAGLCADATFTLCNW